MKNNLNHILLKIDSVEKIYKDRLDIIAENIIKLDYISTNNYMIMLSNLIDGLEYLNVLFEKKVVLNENLIKTLHSIAVRNVDDRAGGIYRNTCSVICNSSHLPTQPFMLTKTMENIGLWLEYDNSHPIVKAANILEKIFSAQPFTNGNIAVSALLMNLIMIKNKLPMIDFNYNKKEFYKALEKSNLAKEDKSAIEIYISEKYLNQIQNICGN